MKTGQCRARHDQTRQDKGTLDLLSEAIIYIGLSQDSHKPSMRISFYSLLLLRRRYLVSDNLSIFSRSLVNFIQRLVLLTVMSTTL